MRSGSIILGVVLFPLTAVLAIATVWFWWAIFWPLDSEWDLFGFNAFWVPKLFGTFILGYLACVIVVVGSLMFGEGMKNDRLVNALSVLFPTERRERSSLRKTRLADRSSERGNLEQALSIYTQLGDEDQVHRSLRTALPSWPITSIVLDTSGELFSLERSIAIARRAGNDSKLTTDLAQQVQSIRRSLWQRAGRITAAAKIISDERYGLDNSPLEPKVAIESERLQMILDELRAARAALADVTYSGGDARKELERIDLRLRAISQMALIVQDFGDA